MLCGLLRNGLPSPGRGPEEGRQHWPCVDFVLTGLTLIPMMLGRSFQIYSELCLTLVMGAIREQFRSMLLPFFVFNKCSPCERNILRMDLGPD